MGRLGQQVQEFRGMVKALHAAGIEVILDVVYNHTAEGNHLGPTLAFKGIDNPSYYRLSEEDRRYYVDYTGTGNSLNVRSPHSLQLIMDSLRYWVQEMHVDGFRFDLAATLAREFYEVDRLSTFFEVVQQDPVVSQVKLIAEPWDVGPGGYQVGNFPPVWTEWNGKYRDTVRDFWRGEPATLAEFASRITGSADLYQDDGRKPFHSINFVTCHDGFTLNDLVSYNDKHNEANGEENRDGESHNRSWNCGVEGPTDDPGVLALRARQRRNFLATLLLSQGVPMIGHGDELGRTQRGNNNAYCQDNELAWVDWDNARRAPARVRPPAHRVPRPAPGVPAAPVLHRPAGAARTVGAPLPDLGWFTPDGREMTGEDWGNDFGRAVMLFVNGEGIRSAASTASGTSTTRSCSASTPTTPRSTSRCRPASTARSGNGSSTTAEPGPDDQRVVEAGGSIAVAGPLPRRPRPHRLMTPLSPPYRVQVRPGFDLAATAGLAGYLAGARRQPPLHRPAAGRHARLRARVRRGRPPLRRPGLRRRGGPAGAGRRAARSRARAWSSTSCPTTPASPSGGEPRLVGRAAARAAVRRTPRWFDIDWDRGPILLPVLADDGDLDDAADRGRRAALLRAPVSRSADGTGDGTPREVHDRQHYRAGRLAARRRRAELPPVLRGHRPGRAAGRGPGGVRRHPRRDPALVADGDVDGIRVDHPDGLRDPAGYLRRLRDAAPDAWLVVEKILEPGEELPRLAGRRHHRLRRARRGLRHLRRPGPPRPRSPRSTPTSPACARRGRS